MIKTKKQHEKNNKLSNLSLKITERLRKIIQLMKTIMNLCVFCLLGTLMKQKTNLFLYRKI